MLHKKYLLFVRNWSRLRHEHRIFRCIYRLCISCILNKFPIFTPYLESSFGDTPSSFYHSSWSPCDSDRNLFHNTMSDYLRYLLILFALLWIAIVAIRDRFFFKNNRFCINRSYVWDITWCRSIFDYTMKKRKITSVQLHSGCAFF